MLKLRASVSVGCLLDRLGLRLQLLRPVLLPVLRWLLDLDLRRLLLGLPLLRCDRLLALSPVVTISVTDTLLSSVSLDLRIERMGLLELAFFFEFLERPPCCPRSLVGTDLDLRSLCLDVPEPLLLLLLSP